MARRTGENAHMPTPNPRPDNTCTELLWQVLRVQACSEIQLGWLRIRVHVRAGAVVIAGEHGGHR